MKLSLKPIDSRGSFKYRSKKIADKKKQETIEKRNERRRRAKELGF